MSRNVDLNFDYRRAVLLLRDRINTPMDLQKIWAFCDAFKEYNVKKNDLDKKSDGNS